MRGKIEGLDPVLSPRLGLSTDSGMVVRGYTMRNGTLLDLYKAVYNFHKVLHDYYSDNRILLNVEHPEDFIFNPNLENLDNWEKDHFYSYDTVIKASKVNELFEYILADVNHYTGYNARVEKRMVTCYILMSVDKKKAFLKDKRSVSQSYTADQLTYLLNTSYLIKHPCINETTSKPEFPIEVVEHAFDIETIRKYLKTYGVDIVEGKRELDMFVISDSKK